MSRQFGIITTTTGVSGIVITSLSTAQSAEIAEARDTQGKVTDLKAYSTGTTISVKGYLDSASLSITAGSTLTLGSVSYLIESVTVSETNTGYAEADISARTADSATVVAYSTASGT